MPQGFVLPPPCTIFVSVGARLAVFAHDNCMHGIVAVEMQGLHNKVRRTVVIFTYRTPTRELYLAFNTLRTGSFKLFKRPFPGFLTILTL